MKTIFLNLRVLGLAVFLASGIFSVSAQPVQLANSQNTALASASASGDSYNPAISPDGRYVLFSSSANNLVTDTNGTAFLALVPARLNVFLRDRTNGTTTLVSVNQNGTGGGNADSFAIGISTNGQYALFESSADNLVAGDTNGVSDVFVRDLVNHTTALVSVSTNGGPANGVSRSAIMTPDGHHVAFVSAATNLVIGDNNGIPDVFVRDLQAGTTVLASVGATTTNASSVTVSSESPDLSADGRYVVFFSTATNLVSGGSTSGEIYVRDLWNGATVEVSAAAHPIVQSLFNSATFVAYNHTISDDGQYIAYQAGVPSGAATTTGVVLRYNFGTAVTDTVFTNAVGPRAGAEADYRSLDMTPDGRFIVFVGKSGTGDLVSIWDGQNGATNPVGSLVDCYWPQISADGQMVSFFNRQAGTNDFHLYVRNMQSGAFTLADAHMDGSYPNYNLVNAAALSADGQSIAFTAFDANLATNDQNRSYDVFVRDLTTNTTELISVRSPSLPAFVPNGASAFTSSSISADGRYIAFSSDANNLTPNDTNDATDIFIHDRLTGSNVLASVAADGSGPGNSLSFQPAISANGRYVAFTSSSSNLTAITDSNGCQDVFVHDLQSGTNILISINTAGTGTGNTNSSAPMMSADGRYVLFRSKSANLVSGVSVGENLFVRDLQLGVTRSLTTNSAGINFIVSMSADGHYAAYGGPGGTIYVWDLFAWQKIYTNNFSATNLVLSPDGGRLVFSSVPITVVDLPGGTTHSLGNPDRNTGFVFSFDGRFVSYNAGGHINLYDLQAGTSQVVATGVANIPAISPDGRFVVYSALVTSFVTNALFVVTNNTPNLLLFDRNSGTTIPGIAATITQSIYGNPSGIGYTLTSANSFSLNPVFSGDSQTLFFQSWASDLVTNDFNQSGDLFAFNLNNFTFSIAMSAPGSLVWPTVAGKNYQVQYKDTLNDLNWQPLNSTVLTNGNQASSIDPAPPLHRFYRVVAY